MAADIVASLGGVDPKQLPDPVVDPNDPTAGATEAYVPSFNNGVEGYENVLILSASRVPRELLAPDKRRLDSNSLKHASDLRRISYWLADNSNNTGGLARQELFGVTSGDFDVKPPDSGEISPESGYHQVIANVTAVMFEYFDGAGWATEWNSNTFTVDGRDAARAAVGHPHYAHREKPRRLADERFLRRVVALPAGNNFPAQQQQ